MLSIAHSSSERCSFISLHWGVQEHAQGKSNDTAFANYFNKCNRTCKDLSIKAHFIRFKTKICFGSCNFLRPNTAVRY